MEKNNESNSKLESMLQQIVDRLNDQVWYQQIKTQWNSLDNESKKNAKLIFSLGSTILIIGSMIYANMSLNQLRAELSEKNDLIRQIGSATDELKRLREQSIRPTAQDNPSQTWTAFLEGIVTGAGIEKSSLTVSAEKPGQAGDQSKESLFDLQLKKITIRQAVKVAFALENAARPIKLRNLLIDTHADPEGYLDAAMSISGFAVKSEEKK